MLNRRVWRRLGVGEFSVKRMVRSGLLVVIVSYAYLCVYGYFFSDRQIFLPPPSSYQDSDEILKIETSDGLLLSALYRPHPTATYTVLFSHGNASDMGENRPILDQIYAAGLSVFAYDYRGYGTSEGQPSERGTYRDIEAAYRYLTETLDIPANQIIAHGHSVGGGPAVDLASREPLAGLIVESSFVSAFRVLTRIPIVPFDKFDNLSKIQSVTAPILIIHGEADTVIPIWHSKSLWDAAPEPKRSFWVEGAGHNDLIWVAGDRYRQVLAEFAQSL